MERDHDLQRASLLSRVIERVCTPIYEPKNEHWELIFKVLGLERPIIESLWCIFWRMNKSQNGHIDILEFVNYFNFDRSLYVEKCFQYFDTTGSDEINFLEFVISLFSICTFEVDTLSNFAFDLYDLSNKGELSLPDLETLVKELYGSNLPKGSIGSRVLNDIIYFAEVRGGVLTLNPFTIFTATHSLLLLPVFNIQKKIQTKVMGIRFWRKYRRPQSSQLGDHTKKVNARQAHLLARRYKKGGVEAMLEYCGNPNDPLVKLYSKIQHKDFHVSSKEDHGDVEEDTSITKNDDISRFSTQGPHVKNEKFKIAANKIKKINAENRKRVKELVKSVSLHAVHSVNTTSSSMLDGLIRARRAIVAFKVYLNPLRRRETNTTPENNSGFKTFQRENDNLDLSDSLVVLNHQQHNKEAKKHSLPENGLLAAGGETKTHQITSTYENTEQSPIFKDHKYSSLISKLERNLQLNEIMSTKSTTSYNSQQQLLAQQKKSYNNPIYRRQQQGSMIFDHRVQASRFTRSRIAGSIVVKSNDV